MGKKSKKTRANKVEAGMGRSLRKDILEICNKILEKCKVQFRNEWEEFVELFAMIEEVQRKQQAFARRHPPRQEHLKPFMQWLADSSVDCTAVAVEDYAAEGLGLKATRLLKEAELVLSIPRKVMMTSCDALQSPLAPLIRQDCILKAMPNIVLSLHLLCECQNIDTSAWAPYLRMLPASYTTPLYATLQDLQQLKGSPSLSDVINQFRNVARQYAYFFKLFQATSVDLPIKSFCYDDYRWAVSTVMTRQNKIPVRRGDEGGAACECCEVSSANNTHQIVTDKDDKNKLEDGKDEKRSEEVIGHKKKSGEDAGGKAEDIALIPFWDMCNHDNGFISTEYNLESDKSDCYAMKETQPHQQLKIFYGPRNSSEFFLHNGFVFSHNRHDCLPIRLGVSKNDTLFSVKAEVMARANLNTNNTFYLSCYKTQPVEPDLIAFLRIFSMHLGQCMSYMGGGESVEERRRALRVVEKWVDVANEMKVWSYLETRCHLLLKNYATTLQEDENLLKVEGALSGIGRNVVLLRASEKNILTNVIEYCGKQKKTVLQFVEENERNVEKEGGNEEVGAKDGVGL